ncbi:MAG: hypothetical protein HWQ35_20360 [Nostoc sp. NMS1]|uniref:hypothetical protein n=1 Tax=unclassified Nostoc TaxID=2593658 RepID=UPI0025F1D0A2|nr:MULTISPECIES: hypothetical protein [unclassified Nostoc]MBN3908814.1 hypothetical protein [Nostoc sp. NMS1]MBN3992328.1 hypothetical protein [Nostoc sp. NMS2]
MPQKHDQTQESVKVCNHKPGDVWDEGCCEKIEAIAKANLAIANDLKNKQIADEETKELIHQTENQDRFTLISSHG